MAGRQFGCPVMIRGDREVPLERVRVDEIGECEDWLQDLLFRHSGLIPIDEIEPAFAKLLPVARELPTPSGPLDLLFVNGSGHLTLVETKLWRNPEKRREVVAQIINYATELSKWSYGDLVSAVRRVTSGSDADPLMAVARSGTTEAFDEASFTDTVCRNLKLGRFLLLIVGDGIHEAVEDMADYLRKSPHLGFTLGLVELALFRHVEGQETLFVQPRVVTRTREVVRAIVEVRSAVGAGDIVVSVPATMEETSEPGRRPPPLSTNIFLERLALSAGANCAGWARQVLEEAPRHGLYVDQKLVGGPMIKYRDDATAESFSFGQFGGDGTLGSSGRLSWQCVRLGLPAEIWREYYEAIRKLIPGSRVEARSEKNMGSFVDIVSASGGGPPLEPLLQGRTF